MSSFVIISGSDTSVTICKMLTDIYFIIDHFTSIRVSVLRPGLWRVKTTTDNFGFLYLGLNAQQLNSIVYVRRV